MLCFAAALAACSPEEKRVNEDFAFDGTCVNCHAGLSAGHSHPNYKLRCIDCHGGNDQINVPLEAFKDKAIFSRQDLLKQAHVLPKPELARFFFANGVDDDNDGQIDEIAQLNGNTLTDFGEVFEPGLHGQGAGEFLDTELQRDLNYARFLNPGDLRVATLSCGGRARAALDGGGGGGCHQQTIDIVRGSMMVNQSAVINGAYYGNQSWRASWLAAQGPVPDPRLGAFGYTLDYVGVDGCIDDDAARADPTGRVQPRFDSACLQARAAAQDPSVAANAPGNQGLPAFEMAQGTIKPAQAAAGTTIAHLGAGDSRLPWGGTPSTGDALADLQPVPCASLVGGDCTIAGVPDPVDNILRTFRAYYPLNYPGSTTNFNFTFGTSILPEIARFVTKNAYGRGHSSGCSACHAPYNYEGSRAPTRIRQDDGTFVDVVDPTTKHREFDGKTQDRGTIAGQDRLIGRAVNAKDQTDTGRAQQKTYSANHSLTAKVDTDTCGLCHGFVTRINYAYQGMAEEEQRDALARRAPIEFTTPSGTKVKILDSWVREDNISGTPKVVEGDCLMRPCSNLTAIGIIEAAKKRDADLAALGLVPGGGGCAAAVFSEDCNNNGELDLVLTLERRDEDGKVIAATTFNEDQNGNGKLDLLDRLPREKSIDGRQVRYVYGGRNGSTRQMDVHFERGMHCIDCHFLQDVHGDGHLYTTNWDAIEIECEDCHGSNTRATLVTSGPNGGNNLKLAKNDDLKPFFEEKGGAIIQRSRVTPGLFWKVPQTVDQQNPYAREAHDNRHIAPPGQGSTFAGTQGSSELTSAKLECAACHGSWIHNCMGCHVDLNVGDPQRKFVDAAGTITNTAGENEVWLSNFNNPGHINFQLLGLLRSPFLLGVGSTTEQGRLAPFRSSMQVHVSVTDGNGDTLIDNATFTTFQTRDANSGRMNVATSAVAMNQTMPHTVRPSEARGCESCHPMVDGAGRVRNEHLLAQTYGLGTGAYPYAGDWAIAAGAAGIELFEHKQEKELAANLANRSQRFPGMIVNGLVGRTIANVEPIFDGTGGINAGSVANDVVLIRNFQPSPVGAAIPTPTLRDLTVLAVDAAGAGRLVITDIGGRGHPTAARVSVGNATKSFILNLPAAPLALAHISPDTSDPFVYAAVGTAGVSVVRIADAPKIGTAAAILVRTVALQGGRAATDVILAGDLLYVGTQQGTVDVLSLTDPNNPVPIGTVTVGAAINDLALEGFVLYAATPAGLASIALDDPQAPTLLAPPVGGAAQGVAVREGRAYLAAGAAGVIEIDVRTAAAPVVKGNISPQTVNAIDVTISQLPGQTWVQVLEANGDFVGIKLDGKQSLRERCFPDPGTKGCLLDLQFMDPTVMSRDPSFDPLTQTFDSTLVDPSATEFFRQASNIIGTGKRLARPAIWEQLGTLTGRRMRDSFMPGSGALSLQVMQRMRGVAVCETNQPSTHPAGLGALGYPEGGVCQPFGLAARQALTCRPTSFGSLQQVCSPNFGRAAGSASAAPAAPALTPASARPPALAPSVVAPAPRAPAPAPAPVAPARSRDAAVAPVQGVPRVVAFGGARASGSGGR